MNDRARLIADAGRLVDECRSAGLVATRMDPYLCHGTPCFTVALWTPAGGLWMEASHESMASVLDAVELWRSRADRAVTVGPAPEGAGGEYAFPAELVAMLDEAAGREHSEAGPVRAVLAAILTRHRELVLAEVAEPAPGLCPGLP